MRMAIAALASMAALGVAAPAQAGDPDGKLQIKLLGSAVLPDGKISKVDTDLIGLPAGLQTEANDNYVPTIAIEYFFNPNLSVETICCTTQHDVDATAGAPGAELVADALIVPATLTLKYHFGSGRTIKPYIGAGPAFFLILDDEPGATAVALGADDFKLDNAFGFALQAGIDVPLGDNGLALSLDAKKYFISSDAHWYAGGTEVIGTEHKLDPWVLSAGLGFRF